MMDWLIGEISALFGVTIQNWMLLIGGGLLLFYICRVLAIAR